MPRAPRILYSSIPDPRAFARAILDPAFLSRAQTLKADSRSIVRRAEAPATGPADEPFVIKTRVLSGPRDGLNRLLRNSQHLRHIRGARFLTLLRIPTADVLLLARTRSASGALEEHLVMRALPGRSLLHHLDDAARRRPGTPPLPAQCAIARAVGAHLPALAAARLYNRDHKPSNLIVLPPDPARDRPGWTVAVIDTVAIRPDRVRTGGLRMLTSLMLEPLGCGCPPSRTMRMRALIAATTDPKHPRGAPLAARKAVWRAVAQAVHEHGDPTPRTNPLG